MTGEIFFQELKRLIQSEPKPASHVLNSEGCDFAEHVYFSKNLFFAFDSLKSVEGAYLYDCVMCTNCVDCDYCSESELCYESVDANKCFNSEFLQDCTSVRDSTYCSTLVDCHDMFGCTNLRNKSFCVFNRQLDETSYHQAVAKYKAMPPLQVLAYVEQLKKHYPLTQTHEHNNENSPFGNYVKNSQNCYMCFDASNCTDCGYIYDSLSNKSSYDVTYSTELELCYQVTDSGQCFNCDYLVYCAHCQDSSYLINCFDVKNSLGCVGPSHKQYCILNRQLTKEDYERIAPQILADIHAKLLEWADLTY